jgi:hypothetical protein
VFPVLSTGNCWYVVSYCENQAGNPSVALTKGTAMCVCARVSLSGLFICLFMVYLTSMFLAQHRLRVFENRVLRRIFGPKRDE